MWWSQGREGNAGGYNFFNSSIGNLHFLLECIGILFNLEIINGTSALCGPPLSRMLYA
jgi:hypothetical protein